jgi:hypothetical protein
MSTGLNMMRFMVDYIQTMKSVSIVGFDFLKTRNHLLRSSKARYHNSDCEEAESKKILTNCEQYIPFSEKYVFAK